MKEKGLIVTRPTKILQTQQRDCLFPSNGVLNYRHPQHKYSETELRQE
jgi:hypothetical protein